MGKLFTSVLNERINSFLEENNLLGQEQAGFRKGYSTTDHTFSLHCLIDLYLQRKKRLYCTFIDYRKAFDKVQRNILWDKLIKTNVCGNMLTVIKDMYCKAKSCVKTRQGLSRYFSCNIGVRQGENLSPILFALFLNDLKEFLYVKGSEITLPVRLSQEMQFSDIECYMHLFLLMYADDTIALAESPSNMQECLVNLEAYCDLNGLHINTSKTKVVVFSRGKIRNLPRVFFKGEVLDVVFEYKYLGTVFNYNNKFTMSRKYQVTVANKAMFGLLRKCRKLDLPIDLQLDLFEKCIHPILLYGCEIWAHENTEICDKLQLRFMKLLLKLRKTTPTCMVLGELGKFPVSIEAKSRMLSFWYKLQLGSLEGSQKLSVSMLNLCRSLYDNSEFKMSLLCGIKNLLDSLGLSFIWHDEHAAALSLEQFKYTVKQLLHDQFIQSWKHEIDNKSVCINYRLFKEEFQFEKYLVELSPNLRTSFLRFRVTNHRLPIQRLRTLGVPRELRTCDFCNLTDIADEFHYLFNCTHDPIVLNRNKLLPKYYLQHANILKMNSLMNMRCKRKLINLCKFVKYILSLF